MLKKNRQNIGKNGHRIEPKHCLISTPNLPALFDIFILLHIRQDCVCFDDFILKRALWM